MANEWNERLRGYLAARSPRERQTLAVGGAILLVLIGYGMIYEPITQARAKLAAQLPAKRAELRLLRAQSAEIEYLRKHMGESANGTAEQRVKASAAAFGLVGNFTKFTALAGNEIQLATQPLPTATWSDWLGDLERHGITVQRCRISAGGQPGLASLELTLKGGLQ